MYFSFEGFEFVLNLCNHMYFVLFQNFIRSKSYDSFDGNIYFSYISLLCSHIYFVFVSIISKQ